MAAYIGNAAQPFDNMWSQSAFAASRGSEEGVASRGPEGAGVDAAAGGLLGYSDVRGLDYGYADDGKSVQGDKLHAKGLTDRRIMQRTLLMGKPSISSKEACHNMRSSNADGKKALPEPTWATVMEKGLKGCDVAWFDNGKVMLKAIPSEPADRVTYDNALMALCGLTVRDLLEAMQKSKSKHDEKQAAAKAARRPQQEPAPCAHKPLAPDVNSSSPSVAANR